jgi:hypothetical protein
MCAERVAEPSLRRLAHLIIDSNTAAPRLIESPASVSKVSTSRPLLESNELAGIDLGLRHARRLVSPLAIDHRWQTKLPKHTGAVSRSFRRMNLEIVPLITTDGFKFYERVIGRVFGPACVYGQVMKTRRNDHVVKVEGRAVIGEGGLKQGI